MRQISKKCWNSNQSWYYEWIGAATISDYAVQPTVTAKFKISIKRNAYDEQSYARGYIYDAEASKWNQIVNDPITACDCRKVSYVVNDVVAEAFHADRERLLNELREICL